MPTTSSVNESIRIYSIPGTGAEDVLVSDDGRVYTGTEEGVIHELDPETSEVRAVGRVKGRPLGLEWLADGRILVCDSYEGLFALDIKSGEIECLTDNRGLTFCNNAAVHSEGYIYFTDSSRVFPLSRWKAEFVEDTQTGRLLQREPGGAVTTVMEGLRFSNGVAISADESYVVVAELNARTLHRRWLTGTKRGRTEVFASDLPGYPDNLSLGSDGLIWVAVVSPTDPVAENLRDYAPLAARKVLRRLPEKITPKVQRTARVMAFDDQGNLMHDRQLNADRFHMVTGVREHNGTVWMGSLVDPAVACFDVD